MTTVTPDSDEHAAVDVSAMGTRPGATEAEVVTGPTPVVDLAGGHLHVSVRRGVTIVAVDGGLDDALAAMIAPDIQAAVADSEAVVLDLEQVTLLDRSALDTVCAALEQHEGTGRCIVAPRLSGRLVLDRWNVPDTFAVFGSVPDALQARTFIESGYGEGWSASATT